jgi:L-ribulose-5-phosphate 4-epimerase
MFEELKEQVCQANRALITNGLVTLTWGNVSGLSADRQVMVIKPSGVTYAELRPEHMVAVHVETGHIVDGGLKPSSDAPTHRLLYQSFTGIGGVTHTHSPRATAFAQARREIPCFGTTHADHFYGVVPLTRGLTAEEVVADYELNTGRVIVERFRALDPIFMPAVLVPGHAPFAWGKNALDSVQNAIALEAVAAMALDSLALNPTLTPLESYLLDKHYLRKHGKDAYYGQHSREATQ